MTSTIKPEAQNDSSHLAQEGKHLTFNLDNEGYGISILKIKEIIGLMAITSVPQTPPYMKGVINLRGQVIPIIDLRLRFGMEAADYTERTCIIVMEIDSTNGGCFPTGIVVDSVSEVLNIKAEDIDPPPRLSTVSGATSFIQGMAKINDKVEILLDINHILRTDELQSIEKMAHQ